MTIGQSMTGVANCIQILAGSAAALALSLSGTQVTAQCDPQEVQQLLASDGSAGSHFGTSVAVSEGVTVLGAIATDDLGTASGSAYVFEWDGSMWIEKQKLLASDGQAWDELGWAVALRGDLLAVGTRASDFGIASGSAYVFRRNVSGDWHEVAELTASDGAAEDMFGTSIAMFEESVLVGCLGDDDFGSASGSVYLFEEIEGVWSEVGKLTASDASSGDQFGRSIAISGDTLVVGAHNADGNVTATGCAYVFRRIAGIWSEVAKLAASDAVPGDDIATNVAIADDVIVVSGGDATNGTRGGSAYVFKEVNGNWVEVAKLTASDGALDDEFGRQVAVDNDTVIISASYHDEGAFNTGAVYVFRDIKQDWTEVARLSASDAHVEQYFGACVALVDDTAFIGAVGDDTLGNRAGSAYIFDLNCDTGMPATLTDFSVAFGSLVSGGLQDLVESDDARLRTRSISGFTAEEANLMELRIGAETAVQNASAFDLTREGRLNQPGGVVRVRFRNWSTNAFQQVHQYAIGFTEEVETVEGIDAANRVRASDGRIELSLRHSVFATFSAPGFDSFTDFVSIEVEE